MKGSASTVTFGFGGTAFMVFLLQRSSRGARLCALSQHPQRSTRAHSRAPLRRQRPASSIQEILQSHLPPALRPGALENLAAAMGLGGGVDANLADEAVRIVVLERLGGGVEDGAARRQHDD